MEGMEFMRVRKIMMAVLILMTFFGTGCQKEVVREIEKVKKNKNSAYEIDICKNLSSDDRLAKNETILRAMRLNLPTSIEDYKKNTDLPEKIEVYKIYFEGDQEVTLIDPMVYLKDGDRFSFTGLNNLDDISLFLYEITKDGINFQILGKEWKEYVYTTRNVEKKLSLVLFNWIKI